MPRHSRRRTALPVLIGLSAATAVAGSVAFARLVSAGGWGIVNLLLILVFAVLYFWIGVGFWTATFGFVAKLIHPQPAATIGPEAGRPPLPADRLPKTAIAMPIYQEDPRRVFANLRAIRASLDHTGQSGAFDIFALSDTRNPDVWAEEEWAWARMRASAEGEGLFYRRRRRKHRPEKRQYPRLLSALGRRLSLSDRARRRQPNGRRYARRNGAAHGSRSRTRNSAGPARAGEPRLLLCAAVAVLQPCTATFSAPVSRYGRGRKATIGAIMPFSACSHSCVAVDCRTCRVAHPGAAKSSATILSRPR